MKLATCSFAIGAALAAALAIAAAPAGAGAAEPPAAPAQPQTVTLDAVLAQDLYRYLTAGGSQGEAAMLARQLAAAAQAPQRDADLRKQIEAEVRAKLENEKPKGDPN